MGKSKGGGEEAARPTTSNIASAVSERLKGEKREPQFIKVERVTEGVYSVLVSAQGEPDDEAFFIALGSQRGQWGDIL